MAEHTDHVAIATAAEERVLAKLMPASLGVGAFGSNCFCLFMKDRLSCPRCMVDVFSAALGESGSQEERARESSFHRVANEITSLSLHEVLLMRVILE